MNLPLDIGLHRLGQAIGERILPALGDTFAIEAARLGVLLLTISANAIDDAAALRVDENRDMRALFAQTAPILIDAALAAALEQAAASHDPGLRISELDVENDRLRRLLIVTHAAVEVQDDTAGVDIAQKIWRMLASFEARRAPQSHVPPLAVSAA